MVHQMLKGYSFLLYFLSIIASFFIGLVYAGLVEAGKNQGLAGGAIVFWYGIIGAFIGLMVSLFVAYRAKRKLIVWLNVLLLVVIGCIYGYFHLKYLERQKEKIDKKETIRKEKPRESTAPAIPIDSKPTAMLFEQGSTKNDMGLGMFRPNFSTTEKLYFYQNPNMEKSRLEHVPLDSITFQKTEYGGYEITSAPPWLVPAHLKLDYDILYFKVLSISDEFVEVEVNTLTNRKSFVSKFDGNIIYWPEFLLNASSVEFKNRQSQNVYIKPMHHASVVRTAYSFMKPVRITNSWMQVDLVDAGFNKIGMGWIQWKKDDKLLVEYHLLS